VDSGQGWETDYELQFDAVKDSKDAQDQPGAKNLLDVVDNGRS
jgi:hypothetical protein